MRPPHSAGDEPDFARLVPTLKTPVSVPLGRLESTIFMRVDGRRSVLDIAHEVGLAPYEVLRIIERLLQLVPDLRLTEANIVELSVDDLDVAADVDEEWDAPPTPNERTAELKFDPPKSR